eukprot:CAMPEP_0178395694 /NCGR_PEP_ID=MMETSP0689_2-20121128/13350_1 /TAXON_ID=160604 /ORGANISM="Amphidinium massartii, Strain CS-259" /LENGTH=680 /DNA_ID=CAMNT_0020016355 /DNA_START=107 /DNA_END=2146 /DNA_ORIENTATION=+
MLLFAVPGTQQLVARQQLSLLVAVFGLWTVAAVRPGFEADERGDSAKFKTSDIAADTTPQPYYQNIYKDTPNADYEVPKEMPEDYKELERLLHTLSRQESAMHLNDDMGQTRVGKNGWCMFFAQGQTDLSKTTLTKKGAEDMKLRMDLLHMHYKGGEYNALDFITGFDGHGYIVDSHVQEVWVAPDRGALASTLIILAKAWSTRNLIDFVAEESSGGLQVYRSVPLPDIRVLPALRGPRMAWKKDGIEDYLLSFVKSLAKETWSSSNTLQLMLTEAAKDMASQIRRAEQGIIWWKPKLSDAVDVYANIHDVKQDLARTNVEVLIVAHADLASFMFAGLLGEPQSSKSETQAARAERLLSNVKKMARDEVWGLRETGIVKVKWQEMSPARPPFVPNPDDTRVSYPYFCELEDSTPAMVDANLENRAFGFYQTVPFDSAGFAGLELVSQVPAGSRWYGPYAMRKRKKKMEVKGHTLWSRWKDRLIYIVFDMGPTEESKGTWMTWSTPFGEEWKGFRNAEHISVEKLQSGHGLAIFLINGEIVEEEWELTDTQDVRFNRGSDCATFYDAWEKLDYLKYTKQEIDEMGKEVDDLAKELTLKWSRPPSVGAPPGTYDVPLDAMRGNETSTTKPIPDYAEPVFDDEVDEDPFPEGDSHSPDFQERTVNIPDHLEYEAEVDYATPEP